MPSLRAEEGFIEYVPCLDADFGWESRAVDPRSVTVVEQWASMEALQSVDGTAARTTARINPYSPVCSAGPNRLRINASGHLATVESRLTLSICRAACTPYDYP